MNNLKREFYFYLACQGKDWAKIYLSLTALVFAIFILAPVSYFTGFPFTLLDFQIPEKTWGWLFLVNALLGGYSITGRKKTLINTLIEKFDACLCFFLWSILTLTIIYSSSFLAATLAPMITGTFLAWWVLIRTYLKNGRLKHN